MWLLNFLPNWFLHAVLLASICGLIVAFVFGNLPFVGKYLLPIKIISLILFVGSLWLEGGIANQRMWEDRVKQMEAKIKESEIKSKKANLKLIETVNTKTKQIKESNKKLKQRIKDVENKIDAQCVVDPEAIRILNEAARSQK